MTNSSAQTIVSILCATDFSPAASAAADVACALAGRRRVPLWLLYCSSDWIMTGEVVVPLADEEVLKRQLEAEANRLREETGVEVRTELRSGVPDQEIVAEAVQDRPEFLVIGSTGRGRAERWLIGSVAERVAERAPVPTLVVRQPDVLLAWLRGGAALRLLCAVDRTASTGAALTEVATLRSLGGLEIEAASILTGKESDYAGDEESRQRDIWERIRETLGEGPVQVHVRDRTGGAVPGFLEIAEERKADLLVVGSHQRHGWERLKAPSFSRGVLTHAHGNVLCVPAVSAPSWEPVDVGVPKVERILVATKFSDSWPEALRVAISLLPGGGTIHLLHVCPEPKRGINPLVASAVYFDHCLETAKAREEAEAKFRSLPEALTSVPGVRVESEVVVQDDAAAAVCATAERIGADLICLESKGVSKSGALLGSTVLGVLSKAHKPVLIVTPPLP